MLIVSGHTGSPVRWSLSLVPLPIAFQIGGRAPATSAAKEGFACSVRRLRPTCSLQAMIRHSSDALDHNNADVVGSFGEIQHAPFDRLENLVGVFMFDGANRIFELLGKVWFFAPRMLQ